METGKNGAAVQTRPRVVRDEDEGTVTVTMGGFGRTRNGENTDGVMAVYTAPIPADGDFVHEWNYTVTLVYNKQRDTQTGIAYVEEDGSLRYVSDQNSPEQTGGTVKVTRIDPTIPVTHGYLPTYFYDNYNMLK